MSTPVTIGARGVAKKEKDEPQKLKHVHIGVFFDGTSNNMVQQLTYKAFLGFFNISFFGLGKNLKEEVDAKDLEKGKNKIYDLRGELHVKNFEYYSLQRSNSKCLSEELNAQIGRLKEEISSIEEKIDKESALLEVSEKNLRDYSDKNGFSNVSILYSLFNRKLLEEQEENPAKAIKFYIEGSGATDMSCIAKSNVNGLGFGLGDTGVTALVSKGVRLVTNYINSLDTEMNGNTKVHFYVFGFSRGATCARLFTHIATRKRDCTEILKVREKEFKDFIPNLVDKSGRVKFLEDADLNWNNITVDILGIYDTVASIGFLRQKDGWVDPLRAPYEHMPNYIENWHYKNVTQYGLYLCSNKEKLKYVVHIGALDEFRENFAFTNIGAEVPDNAVEILIPGCHSDVGGGYMNNDKGEQEISLPFFTTKADKRFNTKIPLHKYDKTPPESKPAAQEEKIDMDKLNMDELDSAPLRAESLEYVGWIADWDVEKSKSKKDRDTISMAEHHPHLTKLVGMDNWGYVNKIYFKRRVKRGWSDVSLKIMIDKVNTLLNIKGKLLNNDLFQSPCVYDYKKTLCVYDDKKTPHPDTTAQKIADDIISECSKTELKKRYLIIPGDKISSELYKYLRLHYIHFTSTISIGHGVNPFRNKELNIPIEVEPGNFGNKPNFDIEGNLCRITYHGDKVAALIENLPDNSYRTHVHYMYELKFSPSPSPTKNE